MSIYSLHRSKKILCFFLLCFFVPHGFAQSTNKKDNPKFRVGLFSFDTVVLNQEASENLELANWGIAGYFSFSRIIKNIFILEAGGNWLAIKDRGSFNQRVREFPVGQTRTAKSNANILGGYIEAGLSLEFIKNRRAEILLGTDGYSGHRGISNCFGCRGEDIDIKGGRFVHFRLFPFDSEGWRFYLSYKRHFGRHIAWTAGTGFYIER